MHLVGFIIRIYHNARSPERQITCDICLNGIGSSAEQITCDIRLNGIGSSTEQILSHVFIVAVVECVYVSQVVGPRLCEGTQLKHTAAD